MSCQGLRSYNFESSAPNAPASFLDASGWRCARQCARMAPNHLFHGHVKTARIALRRRSPRNGEVTRRARRLLAWAGTCYSCGSEPGWFLRQRPFGAGAPLKRKARFARGAARVRERAWMYDTFRFKTCPKCFLYLFATYWGSSKRHTMHLQ